MAETCESCGRYVGLWNLDFSKEITCTRCLLVFGVKCEDITPELPAKSHHKRVPRAKRERKSLSDC